MPKVKVKRKPPELDMNPMVDMAFLLVTFFMLTTTFKTEEPVLIDTPSSQAEIKLPEKDIMIITISEDDKVFFSIDGKYTRGNVLKLVGQRYGVQFSEYELNKFSLLSSTGMPVEGMKEFLNLRSSERMEVDQPGIPCDSLRNELLDWIIFSRITNPKVRVAVKADEEVHYPMIKKIVDLLVENNITRFNLITETEIEVEDV